MKVLIGVTSSVSIYKVLGLIRLLVKRGHEVRVVMTENATKFVSPVLFQTISRNKVFVDNFNSDDPLVHITLSKWADVFVIVPATANIIGKVANGICDDLVSTIAMAFPMSKRRVIVPAMNKEMWANSINLENISKLKRHGWEVLEPEEGLFASPLEGVGKGRLPNEKTIMYYILRNPEGKLKGKKVLVTAGATREYVDNVRFISNDSSGLMGLSVALQCFLAGADVKLIYGNIKYKVPEFINSVSVVNTEEMLNAVFKEYENVDIVIMSAAVSDFKPKNRFVGKLSKEEITTIELEKTPDILATLGRMKKNQLLVGFALGSQDFEEYAMKKMKEKNTDIIVANRIEVSEEGEVEFNPMGSKHNKVLVITKDGCKTAFEGSKMEVAKFIVDVISKYI
jgi:phosphopantothenoylcysteine decarboxylase/phosphopantothenate--cysteine ligase